MVSLKFISQNFRRTHFGVSPGQIIWSVTKLAFWNSVPDNTLGARNYSCCSWNSVRAVPRVTSLWWPLSPRAVSKLLNWWYMQQHNLRELAVFSQNVFFELSKYLPIPRKTRMMFMNSKCKQVWLREICFLQTYMTEGGCRNLRRYEQLYHTSFLFKIYNLSHIFSFDSLFYGHFRNAAIHKPIWLARIDKVYCDTKAIRIPQ